MQVAFVGSRETPLTLALSPPRGEGTPCGVPLGRGSFEGDALVGERMPELETPGVEAKRRGAYIECLSITSDLGVREINRIADDREAELPEVRANLVGAAGDGARFDQGGVIGEALVDAEFGARRETGSEVDVARAGFGRLGANRRVAREIIFSRCANDFREIRFHNFAAGELRLEF